MLLLLPTLYFFVLGSIIGSFTNVLIDRIPKGISIALSRSYCPHCRKKLSALELVPIFSYIFLRGRCSACKKEIPARLLLVEVLIATIYALLYLLVGMAVISIAQFVYLLAVFPILIAIIFTDLEYGIIPDQLLLYMFVVMLSYSLLFSLTTLPVHLITGVIVFLFFTILFFVTYGKGMGFGDVKLSFMLGMFLGPINSIVALYLAFLSGAVISIILVVLRIRKFKGGTIPFGPFLVMSSIVAYFWGNLLIKLFLRVY